MRMTVLLAGVALAWGCGGKPHPPGPVMLAADSVYRAAMRQYRRGDFSHARENFALVLTNPGSDRLAAGAMYYQAECDFANNLYLEAAREFRRVADEHAGQPLAPDALLRAGDAQAQLWQDPELDPEYGQVAMATYRELVARFPESRAAARAAPKLVRLADMFADKEYRNGQFYQRLKAYDSAILYFRGIVADYPQSRYAPQALLRLVQIYRQLDYADERRETCDHLHRYYPQTAGLEQACPAAADSAGAR